MSNAPQTWTGRVLAPFGANERTVSTSVVLRSVALACALGLIASYVVVLREITRFVGGTAQLVTLVVVALGLGLAAAPVLRERVAITLGLLAAIVAFLTYFNAAGVALGTLVSMLDALLSDVITLATGFELIRVVEARTMALAYAPAPAFLTWYLALRRRYALAVVPAGLALSFLVLTGDAWTAVTLAGTTAGAGTVAFGELERRDAGFASLDVVIVVVVVMILCSLFVPLVPGSGSDPTLVEGGGAGTLEGSLSPGPDRSDIVGSVSLSPEVRFTVESEEPSYWRTAVYDRYTGDGWVATGESTPYDDPLDPPPGATDRITQTVTVESELRVMPAAAAPIAVEGDMETYTEVSEHGQFTPSVTLAEGDQYTVVSATVDPTQEQLQRAGTDYPEAIEQRYLPQSDDRSEAFRSRTETIVDGAETPFEKAKRIEEHLRGAKSYSLDVDRPNGDVAETFLLEMDEGYCVYYATAMVQMLRSEGIPARYATGYTEGERVDGDTWVVRGLDAHAWPEVYFPNVGWVAFEPTPPNQRDAVHSDRLDQARSEGTPNVDTNDTEPGDTEPNETEPDNESQTNETDPTTDNESTGGNESTTGESDGGGDDGFTVPRPSPEQVALALIVAVGLAAAAHRAGVSHIVARTIRLYWQRPSGNPALDAEQAYRRLEVLLARRYRPRRAAESPRAYLEALASRADLDDRVYDVFHTRERATYGPGVETTEATAAVKAMDALAREYRPGSDGFE